MQPLSRARSARSLALVRAALAGLTLAQGVACSAEHDAPPVPAGAPIATLSTDERAELCDWLRARTALDDDFIAARCAYEGLTGGTDPHALGCGERRALCTLTRVRSVAGCFRDDADDAGCAGTRVAEHVACIDELRSRMQPFAGLTCEEPGAARTPPPAMAPAPTCEALLARCPRALAEWGIE